MSELISRAIAQKDSAGLNAIQHRALTVLVSMVPVVKLLDLPFSALVKRASLEKLAKLHPALQTPVLEMEPVRLSDRIMNVPAKMDFQASIVKLVQQQQRQRRLVPKRRKKLLQQRIILQLLLNLQLLQI